MRKTKIVCTLGPSTDSEEMARKIMLAGMNIARFNFSHQNHEQHLERVKMLRKVRDELKLPIAFLLDTKGPEIRLGLFKNKSVILKEGQTFTLTTDEIEGDENRVTVSFKKLPEEVKPNTHVLIDDGLIDLVVEKTTDTDVVCTVQNGGKISNNKGVNVPGANLSLPFMSQKDKDDLIFGAENDFDMVAASFTRTGDDIKAMRKILVDHGGEKMKIYAKIENWQGIDNIDAILEAADGIMVARGDMGVEIPIEEIPHIQKTLIKKANKLGKIVITATQMLDSMTNNPRPTRAEVTDVANAIYDGTGAIMLSGETAAGKYPVEVIKTMARIAERTEADIDYKARLAALQPEKLDNITNAISHATCTTAHDLGAKAIVTVTISGNTARAISKYRPECPIISFTPDEKVCRQMNLFWGVSPVLAQISANTDDLFDSLIKTAVEKGLLKKGDLVVLTAGVPLGVSGNTNLLKVQTV